MTGTGDTQVRGSDRKTSGSLAGVRKASVGSAGVGKAGVGSAGVSKAGFRWADAVRAGVGQDISRPSPASVEQ